MSSSKDSLWRKECSPMSIMGLFQGISCLIRGYFLQGATKKTSSPLPSKNGSKQWVEFYLLQAWSHSTDFSRFSEFTSHLSSAIVHLVHNCTFLFYFLWSTRSFRKKTMTNCLLIMQIHKMQESLKLNTKIILQLPCDEAYFETKYFLPPRGKMTWQENVKNGRDRMLSNCRLCGKY